MKVKVSKNKKKQLANLEFNNLKKFEFKKVVELLQLGILNFIENEKYEKIQQFNANQMDDIIAIKLKDKTCWSIFIIETTGENFDDNKVMNYLLEGKTRIFMDLNLVENKLNLYISLKYYNEDIIEIISDLFVE